MTLRDVRMRQLAGEEIGGNRLKFEGDHFGVRGALGCGTVS